jgi:hypothetical protein
MMIVSRDENPASSNIFLLLHDVLYLTGFARRGCQMVKVVTEGMKRSVSFSKSKVITPVS